MRKKAKPHALDGAAWERQVGGARRRWRETCGTPQEDDAWEALLKAWRDYQPERVVVNACQRQRV